MLLAAGAIDYLLARRLGMSGAVASAMYSGSFTNASGLAGVIESVKTASDLFAPVSGVVEEVNTALVDGPQLVNDAPYEGGWLIKVKPDSASEIDTLMTAQQYADQVAGS